MFTGIIESVGVVTELTWRGDDLTMTFTLGTLDAAAVGVGDSISVNGVCLTATRIDDDSVDVDISMETISKTLFGESQVGDRVNLELAMRADGRFGGHIVSGHVDGLAYLEERGQRGRSEVMLFAISHDLGRLVAVKGSICIDGVSLTVNEVRDDGELTLFSINLIPHTLENTTLSECRPGRRTHVELDMVARYLERLNQG